MKPTLTDAEFDAQTAEIQHQAFRDAVDRLPGAATMRAVAVIDAFIARQEPKPRVRITLVPKPDADPGRASDCLPDRPGIFIRNRDQWGRPTVA